MANAADPILVGPSNPTDQILRWAESMPGMTYKTRIVKKDFTRLDGGFRPRASLYALEAYDADFTAFYENLQRNSDGTLKGVGSHDSSGWGDPFMYDAHKHADLPPLWTRRVSEDYKAAAEKVFDESSLKPRFTPPETVEPLDPCAQNTQKTKYEPMKSGVWVDTNFNEDDVITDAKAEAKEKIAKSLQDLVELINNL